MLKLSSRDGGDFMVVSLAGKMDGGPSSDAFSGTFKEHLAAGHRHYVLDMGDLQWMNSAGIQALITTYASIRREGGSLKLRSPNARVLQTLTTARLVPTLFEVVEAAEGSISGTA